MQSGEYIHLSPTLIIGLGGTGSLALQYIKRKIRERLEYYKVGSFPKKIPFIEYLVLDTTAQEEMIEKFPEDEFFNMGHKNISRIISGLEFQSDYNILKWFPRGLDPGQIDSGAGGIRHIGRLCFFLSQPEIANRIKNKIKNITYYPEIKRFLNEHLRNLMIEEGSTINLHIVTSLCGGTGSGCLLDTAYLVKHIISEDLKQGTNSVGHFITTEPFEGEPGVGRSSREYIQYNFAITLSEIEHFTKKEQLDGWRVEYQNSTKVSSNEKPFSIAYLLGYKVGANLNKRHLCEIIGETVALKTVHPDGVRIKGLIDNVKPHVINTEDAKQKRRSYSSYNTRILNIDIDEQMFQAMSTFSAKTIISSICDGVPQTDAIEAAFAQYESSVFAMQTGISKINFESFLDYIKSRILVKEEVFTETAYDAIREVKSSFKRKRDRQLESAASSVDQFCSMRKSEYTKNTNDLIKELRSNFTALLKETDEKINGYLVKASLVFVERLLAHLYWQLEQVTTALEEYLKSGIKSEADYPSRITLAINIRRGEEVARLCAERANADAFSSVLNDLKRTLAEFSDAINRRKEWSSDSRECLRETTRELPDKLMKQRSLTNHYLWTEGALKETIKESKDKFIKKFLTLLEKEYEGEGGINRDKPDKSICFLPHLKKTSNDSIQTALNLVKQASDEMLRTEIKSNRSLMRQQALGALHEHVDLASPAWQIETVGEDVASISITNCPEDSDAGQVISNMGKNIAFSQSGDSLREYIIFRSEHGISINQLSNIRKCMGAVMRKLMLDDKIRLKDLCLDPSWNVAAPMPVEEVIMQLRLYFSLGLLFGLIKTSMTKWSFLDAARNEKTLLEYRGISGGVKRFEAFEAFLNFDCEANVDTDYLKLQVEQENLRRREDEHIQGYRLDLTQHLDELQNLLASVKDVREQIQLEQELRAIHQCLADVEDYIEKNLKTKNASN